MIVEMVLISGGSSSRTCSCCCHVGPRDVDMTSFFVLLLLSVLCLLFMLFFLVPVECG